MVKIYPKCLHKKELSYTATGYLLPCCWLDNPIGWQEPQIKRLMQKHLLLKNNEKVEDIINSKEWKEYFEELKTNPSLTCQKYCSVPLHQAINKAREKYNRNYYEHQDYKSNVKDQKIKICCVYFKGKYSPDYVAKLYNGLKTYCTLPFEFICYSDNPNVKADVVIPLKPHSDIKYHWHKLTFFSPLFAYQKPGDEIIIMDIDQIITGNVDDMIGWPVADNEIITYNKWWGKRQTPKIQGGFIKFKSGTGTVIWDSFIKAVEYWQLFYYNNNIVHYKYFGEQNFIKDRANKNNITITLMNPEWVGVYGSDKKQNDINHRRYIEDGFGDYMILDKPNPKIKIVHFANPLTTIHHCKDDWIKDYWK